MACEYVEGDSFNAIVCGRGNVSEEAIAKIREATLEELRKQKRDSERENTDGKI